MHFYYYILNILYTAFIIILLFKENTIHCVSSQGISDLTMCLGPLNKAIINAALALLPLTVHPVMVGKVVIVQHMQMTSLSPSLHGMSDWT